MSCYSCGSSFGLFKKELGCKNCGYVFCKDCLTKKAAIPKLKNEKHKVCLKCYKILSGQAQPEDKKVNYSPPEALKKRLAKLDEKSTNPKPAKITATETHRSQAISTKGMSKEDIAIATRLQNLKDSRNRDMNVAPPPSVPELSDRLAKLKGQNPNSANSPHIFKSDHRPQAQQVDDLLQEICDEVEIDSHQINFAEDVQNRLDKFKSEDNRPDDLQNNLNSSTSKDQFHYTKTIPHIDQNYKTSSGEQVDWSEMSQLINQAANELEIDASKAIEGLKKDKVLWDRLSKIKQKKENSSEDGSVPNDDKSTPEEQEENEEETCKNIIKQLLEESRLEDAFEEEEITGQKMNRAPALPIETDTHTVTKRSSSPDFKPDSDELPYCCICNNDASLRCMGCDGDLYCKRCYKEGHDREDYEDHRTKPYKPPANKSH